jgi:four helix bundle protein
MADRDRIEQLEERTRRFAIDVVHLVKSMRERGELRPACDQLNRAAGSIAANHRAAGRARSTKEFAAKLHIAHEEADEAAHWLGQLRDTNADPQLRPSILRSLQEARELRNILGKARSTTRQRYFNDTKPP